MNNRMRLRYIAAMIVFILLSLPHHAFAQDLNQGDILADVAVGGHLDESASHVWHYEGQQGQILQVIVWRTSGQFSPELQLMSPSGDPMEAIRPHDIVTAQGDNYRQVLLFDDLPETGVYEIHVSASNIRVESALIANEYSLAVAVIGQHRLDEDEIRIPTPDINFAGLFVATPTLNEQLGINIFGDATVEQPNPTEQRNRFLITGTRTVDLNNVIPISRGIQAIDFENNGVALKNAGETSVFFTDQNIISLEQEGSITHITLENGQTISTDFYRIESLFAVDGFLVLNMATGQRIGFDGEIFEFVRRGGINGEGPNAEPVNILRFDGAEIQTDLIDWQALDVADSQIRLIVERDFRFYSDELSLNLFRQGNSLRPELNDESVNPEIYEIDILDSDNPLSLSVDPQRIADIVVDASQVRVTDLNEGELSAARDTITEVQIADSRILFRHNDGSSSRLLLNQSTIETSDSLFVNETALANQEGYLPRNYNKLGTHFFDYHPQFDISQSYLPVNRVTGNFVYTVEDFSIASHGLPLQWSRTYNSQSPDDLSPADMRDGNYLMGSIGSGWRHAYQYDLDIRYVPLGEVRLILPDGSSNIFKATEDNLYRSSSLLSWTLERFDSSGIWQAYTTEGLTYQFDEIGRLQEIVNMDGASLIFSPIPAEVLANESWAQGFYITESYGRRLEVFADESGLIREIRDPQLRRITYDYSDSGRLEYVQYVAYDETAKYDYRGGYLTDIEDAHSPYHHSLELIYDADGRVLSYTVNPQGDTPFETVYSYADGETTESQSVNGADHVWLWQYDDTYRLTEWRLEDTEWIYRLTYDADGRLASFRRPEGANLSFEFDDYGYLTRFTDSQFRDDAYRLSYISPENTYLHLLSDIDSLQNDSVSLNYDAFGHIVSMTRPYQVANNELIDSTSNYSYDELGRISTVSSPDSLIEYQYDDFGYVSAVGDGSRTIWDTRYDFVGRLLLVDDKREGGKSSYLLWDDDRNRITGVVVDDVHYDYSYDERGNLTRSQVDGREDIFQYNDLNQMISHRDPMENTLEYAYDVLGNLLNDGTNTYAYDAAGFLSGVQETGEDAISYSTTVDLVDTETIYTQSRGENNTAAYYYNGLGRIKRVVLYDRNGGQLMDYALTYTPLGSLRLINELDVYQGREITIANDVQGQPISSTIAGQATTRYAYDEAGQLISLSDPMGRILQYEYDASGNIGRVILPDGAEQNFNYDEQGYLVGFTDAEGNRYLYRYNAAGQVIEIIDAQGNSTNYDYDAPDKLIIKDARGYQNQFEYNDANQLIAYVDAEGNRTDYSYDEELGRLQQISQPLGLDTTIGYLSSGEIGVITRPSEREFLYGYNGSGQIISITNPLGHTTLYAYDPRGLLGEIIDPFGQKEAFVWRDNGRIYEYTATDGTLYRYLYDTMGRLETIDNRVSEQSIQDTKMSYDAAGYVTELSFQTLASSIDHQYRYDDKGRLAGYTSPEGGEWQFEYDNLGRMTFATNPLGTITHYLYQGNTVTVYHDYQAELELESQVSEVFEYDSVGNLVLHIAPDGTISTFEYDGNNRLIERKILSRDGDEHTETYEYDALGRVAVVTDATGLQTNYGYDVFGNLTLRQLISENSENRSTYRYSYDALDNLRRVELPDGQTISMSYNVLNQRVRYVDAENNSWSYSYDNAGNITQISNPLGSLFSFEFDNVNRITQYAYPTGAQVDVTYDNTGMLSAIISPTIDTPDNVKEETIRYGFDDEGRLVNIEHSEQAQIHFGRDALGNITQLQNAGGTEIAFEYDSLGRLITISPPEGETITRRTYDAMGRLTGIEYGEQFTSFAYDGFGNLRNMVSPDHNISYDYNAKGQLLSRSGEYGTIDYVYDEFNRPTQVTIGEETVDIRYNANGWRSNLIRSNGTETSYAYDNNGRVRSLTHLSDGERLDGFIYEYDAAGNMTRVTRTDGRSVLYSYDSSQQLISERWLDPDNELTYSATYSYDLAGNRTEQAIFSEETGRQRTRFVYNRFNQLVEEIQGTDLPVETGVIPVVGGLIFSLPLLWWLRRRRQYIPLLMIIPIAIPLLQQQAFTSSIRYEYDRNGNLVRIEDAPTALLLEYDSLNRLVRVERAMLNEKATDEQIATSDLFVIELLYDGLGRPAALYRDGVQTYQFIYDAYGLVAIQNLLEDSEIVYFSPFEDEVWVQQIDGVQQWALFDGLGTIHRYLNPDGEDTLFNITAFGESEASDWPQLLYLGQLYEPQTQLYWMGARMYDPRLGRFLQRDPVRHDPHGNLYTYAYNHPTGYIDTGGFTPEAAFEGIVPDVPRIDLSELIPQPAYPDIVQAPSVHEQQAAENQRFLELAYETRFNLNEVAFALDEAACDLYLYAYHPAPASYQAQEGVSFRAMLDLYDESNGWLPASRPSLAEKEEAIEHLERVLPILAFASDDFHALTGCAEQLMLPEPPDPTISIADYLAREVFAEMLREIPLYPVIEAELANLQRVEQILPQLTNPEVQVAVPDPIVVPSLSGQIVDLQDDSHSFFAEILLPSVGE